MKRTRAQNPKLQDPLDPTAASQGVVKPQQRRAKQPRQPKVAGAKKTAAAAAAAREAVAAAAAVAAPAAGAVASAGEAEMALSVPDVCAGGGGGGEEAAAAQTAEWDIDGGLGAGSWWTFGVEEEKLLGWFPFVEEDFRCGLGAGRGDAEAAAFDDDIWRIHQIYEIPNYAAK